jgi:hypothetical protein
MSVGCGNRGIKDKKVSKVRLDEINNPVRVSIVRRVSASIRKQYPKVRERDV